MRSYTSFSDQPMTGMDPRRSRHTDNMDMCFSVYTMIIVELPTYAYRRVWALLRRQAEIYGLPAINAKRFSQIMCQNALLLERTTCCTSNETGTYMQSAP